jgi:cell division protein FtsL
MAKKKKSRKKKRTKRNPKLFFAYLLLLVVFTAELLFIAWCGIQSRKIESDIIVQTEKTARLSDEQDKLKIELARLRSPRRITRIARDQLGLITPTPNQTIVIPNDK